MRTRYRLWMMRWLIVGGIFMLVGIWNGDLRAMVLGAWMMLDYRISETREYLELEVLRMETRLQSGATRVWVRKEV